MPVFTDREKQSMLPLCAFLFPLLGIISLLLLEATLGLCGGFNVVSLEAVGDLSPQSPALILFLF